MAWTLVQSAFFVDGVLDSTVGFSNPPTEGNLLVAVSADRNGVDTSGEIVGWVQVGSIDHKPADGTFRMSATVWARIAEASEPLGITFPTATTSTYYNAAFEFEPVGAVPLDLFRLLATTGALDFDDNGSSNVGSVTTGSLNPASDTYCKLGIGVVKNDATTHDPLSYSQDVVAAAVNDSASSTGMTIGIGVDTSVESTPQDLTVTLSTTAGRGAMAFYVLIPEAVPVREFDGSSADELVTDIGDLSGMAYGTFGAIFKITGDTGDSQTIIGLHQSDDTEVVHWWSASVGTSPGEFGLTGPLADVSTTFAVGDWCLGVFRKPTGSEVARISLYNFSTDTWQHADAASAESDWTAPGVGGTTYFSWRASTEEWIQGRVAVRAAWSNSVPWPANSSGDSQIEAAGLEVSLDNWADAFPDALWAFNQDATTTPVSDLTGGGADETSVTGTTVITNDPVPGFSYVITTSSDVDVNAEVATVAATAHNPMGLVSSMIEAATVAVAAHDATVARAGNPDAAEATVTVAAQNATVVAVDDSVEAQAEVATITVEAHGLSSNVATSSTHATVAVAGQGPDITASAEVNPGLDFISVDAFDATVTVTGEGVSVNAEVATVSVVANGATPTGEANALATEATVSVTAEAADRHAMAGAASVAVEALNAQVAVNAGTIATAEVASVSVAAQDATAVISGEVISDTPFTADVAVSALDAVVNIFEPPEPLYTFFPPTVIEHFQHLQDIVFERKFTWEKGVSLVRKDGTFVETRFVVPDVGGPEDLLIDGVDYFVGGFHYIIPESIALELIAAGYAPELIE